MTSCGICGKPIKAELIIDAPESTFNGGGSIPLNIAECKNCGLVQLVDVPLSPDYEISKKSIGFSSAYRETKIEKLKSFAENYELIANGLYQNKLCAEIGCGDGPYLEILIELGVDVIGYEKLPLHNERFDCIFSFFYLEHMPNPIGFVSALYNMLNDGGLVYIEVPNYDYIFSNGVWQEFTRDHRFYFSERTINYLFFMCGFDLKFTDNFTDDSLVAVYQKPETVRTLEHLENQMSADVNVFASEARKKFNLYGASHRAMLMLHLSGARPERIFDSNPAKVGKKVFGIKIEPGANVGTVDADEPIVIICGGYNKEIREMLEQSGKTNIREW